MSRITGVPLEKATGERAEIYSAIKGQLGAVPNLFRAIGESPRALKTFLGIGAGLKGGLLTGQEQNSIALAVAQMNGCDYCLAAHTALGKMGGHKEEEIIKNRKGQSDDLKRDALIKLVTEIVSEKGRASEQTYNNFLAAGYTHAHLPEVLLSIVQNVYTNYFNNFNGTEVDFPSAPKI